MADRSTVLLGVTGSIAAYKAVELARLLAKQGLDVRVAMTKAATEFVTPLTFRSITGRPVAVEMFEEPEDWKAAHLSLADEADVIVVAPATADAIAKLACGIADEILYSIALASRAPLVVAPAMHTAMYEHAATQANLATLRQRGAAIIEAETGELASGDVGRGRLADLAVIVAAVQAALSRSTGARTTDKLGATADEPAKPSDEAPGPLPGGSDLKGRTVLVTAGGTQEPIDPVRYIGNRSSGKTGYAIAAECARRGADVVLVSAPVALPAPDAVEIVGVTTASEMADAVMARFGEADAVIMTAAVADFSPAEASPTKIKKDAAPDSIRLAPNPDILADLGNSKSSQVLIGFAAETGDVAANARAKLESKNLDLVVANDVSTPGIGFGADENEVLLVAAGGDEPLPRLDKRQVAVRIVDRLVELLD